MERVRASFSSDPSEWVHVRLLLQAMLELYQVPPREANLIALAVDEAFTNILRHAYDEKTDCPIEFRTGHDDGLLSIEFQDFGSKCDPSKIKSRDLDDIRPGGLGVHIIKSVFEKVEYDTSPEKGTVLKLCKQLGKSEPC